MFFHIEGADQERFGLIHSIEESDLGIIVMNTVNHLTSHNPTEKGILGFCSAFESMDAWFRGEIDGWLSPCCDIIPQRMKNGAHEYQPERSLLSIRLRKTEKEENRFIDKYAFAFHRSVSIIPSKAVIDRRNTKL